MVLGAGALTGDQSGTLRRMLGISDAFYEQQYGDIAGQHAFAMMPVLLKPQSRGRLRLRSRNPFHWPSLQPNYFAVPSDLRQLRDAVRSTLRIAQSTRAFRRLGARRHDRPVPGCEELTPDSDAYWECHIRRYTASLQHQVGTCRMAAAELGGVLDERLRVRGGIRRLRVADASIMPQLPSAHTNAVVYMIGEKAADMIKADWPEEVSGGAEVNNEI